MKCHPSPIRTVTMQKPKISRNKQQQTPENNRGWYGFGEIRTLMHCFQECRMMLPLWKTVWWFFKVFKKELVYDPEIPPSEELKAGF